MPIISNNNKKICTDVHFLKISISLSVCVTYYTINIIIKKNHENDVGGRIITNYYIVIVIAIQNVKMDTYIITIKSVVNSTFLIEASYETLKILIH